MKTGGCRFRISRFQRVFKIWSARWVDQGALRGSPVSEAKGTSIAAPSRSQSRSRRIVRSLDVVVPTDVKLSPGSMNAAAGGPLSVALRIGPLPAVSSLAIRGDGRLLAVGTFGQVMLWDLNDGCPAGAMIDIPGPVHSLAFSRDGRRLAVGAGLPARTGVVRVYTVPDGTLIHEFDGHEDVVYSLAFRPDGGQIASASFDQTVRLWNLVLGRPDGVFRGHSDFVYSVVYSPDGRTLWTSGNDRTIKRINVRTLKEERTYSGHDDAVLAFAVHPDGKRFVSAGDEPQLRWWNVAGDKPTARRPGHSGPVQQLTFSGDGRRLISVGGDRTVRLWDGMTASRSASSPARPTGNTRRRSPMTAGWRRPEARTVWPGSGTPARSATGDARRAPRRVRQPGHAGGGYRMAGDHARRSRRRVARATANRPMAGWLSRFAAGGRPGGLRSPRGGRPVHAW